MPRSVTRDDVAAATAETIAAAVKSYDVPRYCESLGMAEGNPEDAHKSKKQYVLARLPEDPLVLIKIAEKVVARNQDPRLEEILALFRRNDGRRISDLTRRAILDEIRLHRATGGMSGKLGLIPFLMRVWPLDEMPSTDPRFTTAEADFFQHTVLNDDWDLSTVFGNLDVLDCSEARFIRFLEELLHPVVRDAEDQPGYADALNKHLVRDGLELRPIESVSGYPVYRVVDLRPGVQGQAKNIIFAATGPKPEIVLRDAINNDVEIVRNAEYCLVFDRPVPSRGLRWSDLVAWWVELRGGDVGDKEIWRQLYRRLEESLSSPPEKLLFRTCYATVMSHFDGDPPALLPQVYLHLDPLTIRERGGSPVLARQRMDFLLLLSARDRVVVEVDGKQHYSEGDVASPKKYGELVAADRELKLAGYEVFRFGGAELDEKDGERLVSEFFTTLLEKRGGHPT